MDGRGADDDYEFLRLLVQQRRDLAPSSEDELLHCQLGGELLDADRGGHERPDALDPEVVRGLDLVARGLEELGRDALGKVLVRLLPTDGGAAAPRAHGGGEALEGGFGRGPVHAGGGDGDAVLARGVAGLERLRAAREEGGEHHTEDGARGGGQQGAHAIGGGGVGAVEHHQGRGARCGVECGGRARDAELDGGEVGGGQHEVAVAVARGLDDAGDALLRDGEEGVRRARGAHGVGDELGRGAVARLGHEADHGREARGELAVQRRLGGALGDARPRDQVRDELRRDRVEVHAAGRQPEPVDVEEQLPRLTEALVDLERAVEPRVVHGAAPVARAAGRLIEEDTHHEDELAAQPLADGLQLLRVLHRGDRVVRRDGTAHHHEPFVLASQRTRELAARAANPLVQRRLAREVLDQARRRDERLDAVDPQVVQVIN